MTRPKSLRRRAARSWTVRFAALVPVALAALAALQDTLPFLSGVLTPWTYAGASIGVSVLVAILRLRRERDDD